MRGTSFPVQQTRHIGPLRTVERHTSDTGHVFAHSLEGGHMVSSLEHELSLISFDVDTVEVGNCRDLALGDLDLGTKRLCGADLRNVTERVFSLSSDSETAAKGRQNANCNDDVSQAFASSFDFDGHDAANTRHEQAPRERRSPYDWSLDEPGQAYHIGPSSPVIPPDLDPHVKRPTILLSASRPTRLEVMRATMLGYAVIAFLAALSVLAFGAAAVRLPAVQQASIDAEGV